MSRRLFYTPPPQARKYRDIIPALHERADMIRQLLAHHLPEEINRENWTVGFSKVHRMSEQEYQERRRTGRRVRSGNYTDLILDNRDGSPRVKFWHRYGHPWNPGDDGDYIEFYNLILDETDPAHDYHIHYDPNSIYAQAPHRAGVLDYHVLVHSYWHFHWAFTKEHFEQVFRGQRPENGWEHDLAAKMQREYQPPNHGRFWSNHERKWIVRQPNHEKWVEATTKAVDKATSPLWTTVGWGEGYRGFIQRKTRDGLVPF